MAKLDDNIVLQELEKIIHNLNDNSVSEIIKQTKITYILGFASSEICNVICCNEIIMTTFLKLLNDGPNIAKVVCKLLINISADDEGASKIYYFDHKLLSELTQDYKGIIPYTTDFILHQDSIVADAACMLLSNLTRSKLLAEIFWRRLSENTGLIDHFVAAFCAISYNTNNCTLDYLGPLFSNLSQLKEIRCYFLDNNGSVLQKLLPFTELTDSIIRKGGVIGVLRNCSFDTEFHDQLLKSELDILPRLLLPLAGPEEFSEEDVDKLPIDLQYLPDSKLREPDPDIRTMLLETMNQLCATRSGREYLRDHNAYLILREYHKWETDRNILLVCENVVDILIRTEAEIDVDNIQTLNVPPDMAEKFEKLDADFVNGS